MSKERDIVERLRELEGALRVYSKGGVDSWIVDVCGAAADEIVYLRRWVDVCLDPLKGVKGRERWRSGVFDDEATRNLK